MPRRQLHLTALSATAVYPPPTSDQISSIIATSTTMKLGCLGFVAIVAAAAVAGLPEANAAASVRADEVVLVGRQSQSSSPSSSSSNIQRGGSEVAGGEGEGITAVHPSTRPTALPSSQAGIGISIVPNRILPPVLAGASLGAFQAVQHESVFSSSSSPSLPSSYGTPASKSSSSTSSSPSSSTQSPPISYSYSSTLPTSDDIINTDDDDDAATGDLVGHVSLLPPPYPPTTQNDDYSYKTTVPRVQYYRLGIRRGGEEVVPSPQDAVDLAMRSAQWQEAKNRTVAATALLALLSLLSYYFKEDGLIMFSVLLQIIMFQESSFIVGGDLRASSISSSSSSSLMTNGQLNKWWWFVTMVLLVDGPRLFPWMANKFGAVAYSMVVLNIMSAIIKFQWTGAKTAAFREYVRQSAVSLLCLSFVVVPSSYWIGVFEEHGQKWLLLPAALSIFDDLIAFLVGMVAGKPTPSSSSIAPKKTWQGYAVGAIMTMGATWLALDEKVGLKYLPKIAEMCPYSQMDGLVLAAVASIVAPFGGSVSSLIKRAYGHKKFGTIFGGRIGGLVDLLDGQLMMAPFIYFFLSLYKFRNGSAAT